MAFDWKSGHKDEHGTRLGGKRRTRPGKAPVGGYNQSPWGKDI
jgi:hypothetical protein